MDLSNMLTDIRTEINELTRLEYYLNSDEVRSIIKTFSGNDSYQLQCLIKLRNLGAIKEYIRKYQSLQELSVKELRRMAANLRIQNYHTISKDELIERITKCRSQEITIQASKTYMNV